MPEFSKQVLVGSAFVAASKASRNADKGLLALIANLRSVQDRVEWQVAAPQGAVDWPRIETLGRVRDRLRDAIVSYRVSSLRGVAHKLALWRSEAAHVFPDGFDHAHELGLLGI